MDQVAPTSTTVGELNELADTAKNIAEACLPANGPARALMRIEQILRYAALVEEQQAARRVAHPTGSDQFCAELYRLGVKLPLVVAPGEGGFIHDARGNWIASIDMKVPPAIEEQLAGWLAMAVNTCGGFVAEVVR